MWNLVGHHENRLGRIRRTAFRRDHVAVLYRQFRAMDVAGVGPDLLTGSPETSSEPVMEDQACYHRFKSYFACFSAAAATLRCAGLATRLTAPEVKPLPALGPSPVDGVTTQGSAG